MLEISAEPLPGSNLKKQKSGPEQIKKFQAEFVYISIHQISDLDNLEIFIKAKNSLNNTKNHDQKEKGKG